MKRLRRLILSVALLGLFSTGALVAAGLNDDATKSDVAIVLGSKVELTGQPSARLAARLDQGAAMYRQGLAPMLIVSGGTGVEGFAEAAVMRDYLVRQGIPASAIVLDSQGVDTEATARNSARIMREHGWTSAIVVTQYFHVPRTRLALRQAGIRHVSATHARFVEGRDIYSTLRELVALPTYWAKHQSPE